MSAEEFESICHSFSFVRDVVCYSSEDTREFIVSKYTKYVVYFTSMFSVNKDSIDEWKRQWNSINSLLSEYKIKLPFISFDIYQIVVQGEG